MPTVIATPGAADANSYLTMERAAAILDERLNATAWIDAVDVDRKRAVIMATRVFETQLRWLTGAKATTTQALAWPRMNAVDEHGDILLSTIIPVRLEVATAEMALWLLAKDRTAESGGEADGIARVVAGPVEVEFTQGYRAGTHLIPDLVLAMLGPWAMPTMGVAVPLVRV